MPERPDSQWRCRACGAEWTMPHEGGDLPECCDRQEIDVEVLFRDGQWRHPSALCGAA